MNIFEIRALVPRMRHELPSELSKLKKRRSECFLLCHLYPIVTNQILGLQQSSNGAIS